MSRFTLSSAFLFLLGIVAAGGGRVASADDFGSGGNAFSIEFTTIGAVNNAPDVGGLPFGAGAVAYAYRLGTYEISEQMIDKANAIGALGITKATVGPNKPAAGISWVEAARFVNWLNTSTGSAPAYRFSATGEPEYWAVTGTRPAQFILRNPQAKYFLPSVDEWYKAAYYDPVRGIYYDYPTGSNAIPDGIDFVGDPVFDAVFFDATAQLTSNDVTNVGIPSPFGVFGLGGNIAEWNETEVTRDSPPSLVIKSARGGSWGASSGFLRPESVWISTQASNELASVGFRVASVVPEPRALISAALAVLPLFIARLLLPRRH